MMKFRKNKLAFIVATICACEYANYANAAAESSDQAEEIVVTGIRAALANGLETKRTSAVLVDEINADDVAEFPDSNLAEALQRLPGISIDRENGEGKTITVRGLGGDFTSTTLNGMDVLATSGGGNSGNTPNRSRAFDFNTFASELFSSLKVQKSASASTDEGSLGATVGLTTARPLSKKGLRTAFSAEGAYYDNGGKTSPRIAGLISQTFLDDTLGVALSGAYGERSSVVDKYDRNTGVADIVYRNSQHAGITPNTYGYARPSNATNTNAALSCVNFPNQVGCGSDPTAYAALPNTAFIPTFPTLSHQEIDYQRTGITFTTQWAPTDDTMLTFDALKSKYDSTETLYEIVPISGNRNLYNAAAASNPSSLTAAAKRALYPTCTLVTTGVSQQDCGQALNGTTLVSGTSFSYNPKNLESWDYYNWTGSPGYVADPNKIAMWRELVGRPNMQVKDVHIVNNKAGQPFADYIALDNVDWRNATDGSQNSSDFSQYSLNFDQKFGDQLSMHALLGKSKSEYTNLGLLVEFNNLDKDGFVFDERDGGSMPNINMGFDPKDPSQWHIVKGLTNVRNVRWTIDNSYKTDKVDFSYKFSDEYWLNFGYAHKKFESSSLEMRRVSSTEAQVPTELEAGKSITDFGKQITFGEGINVPTGTPTGWFAPSFDAWRDIYDVECNCINQWGDWRRQERTGSTNTIQETDRSQFVDFNFKTEIADRNFFGNVGVRRATTKVESSGLFGSGTTAIMVTAENTYNDVLPSMNIAYEVMPDTLARFAVAKVIARPQLATLKPNGSPSATCTGTTAGCATDPGFTMGNPYVDPFRATNYDLSFEWYFMDEGLLSLALFYKDVKSFPQNVTTSGPLSDYLKGTALETWTAGITNAPLAAHIANGGNFNVTAPQNAPGGFIKGYELSYQQPFTFLPAPWDKLGMITNYTHINSELEYIINATTGQTQTAPYLNASPDSLNTTLYYQADNWEVRLSGSYRAEYGQAFPVASGTCEIGLTTNSGAACNSPTIADFRSVRDNLFVDASFHYDFSKNMSVTLEAQNLTNETTRKWVYSDVELAQQYLGSGRIFSLGFRLKM